VSKRKMEQEKQNNPKLDLKNVPLLSSFKIELSGSEPIKTGEGQYGEWHLWAGYVEHQKVLRGKGKEGVPIDDYSGKVIFFPSQKLHEKLITAANDKTGVQVEITKHVEQGFSGQPIIKYLVKKLSEGKEFSAELLPTERKFIEDTEKLKESGYTLTEDDIVKASKEEIYGGQISPVRAKELFSAINNRD